LQIVSRKYLTYKEWKHPSIILTRHAAIQSKYLTYKEWKHHRYYLSDFLHLYRKYLTYKEWKRSLSFLANCFIEKIYSVSTLPIRNGNIGLNHILITRSKKRILCKYLTYKEWKL